MKGAPLEFGGHSFQGLDSCIAWARTPKHDFGAMKIFVEWKPTNGQGGASARLKEGLEGAWQQIRGSIGLFLGRSPAAKGVMQEMLAEYKIRTSAIFITELTLYYDAPLTPRRSRSPVGQSSPSSYGLS